MVSQSVILSDEIGFHARTAAIFSKAVAKFDSDVLISFGEKTVKGRSMLAIMTLGAKNGDEVLISAEGGDENETLAFLVELIQSNFELKG